MAVWLGFDPSLSERWTVEQWARMYSAAREARDVKMREG